MITEHNSGKGLVVQGPWGVTDTFHEFDEIRLNVMVFAYFSENCQSKTLPNNASFGSWDVTEALYPRHVLVLNN